MIRGLARLPALGGHLWHLLREPREGCAGDDEAEWLAQAARSSARVFDLRVEVRGEVPASGLVVANHLGYLDIIALASVMPCRFVAKREVARWPVFGTLATKGGTIYIDRTVRRDVHRVGGQIADALREGTPVVVFPEGTSSDGTTVLPFRSSLLEPALRTGAAVTPVHISYHLPEGCVARDVAYWGDMTLVPHLIRLLGRRKITARLHFGARADELGDRKRAAAALREAVAGLRWDGTDNLSRPGRGIAG